MEIYGGAILNTWLDRPLSASGRVALRSDDVFHPRMCLVDFKKPFLTIPNLAIHMNREVNKGVELNRQTDMLPVFGLEDSEEFLSRLAEQLQVGVYTLEDIVQELIRPGRDPREDVPAPVLRSDVLDFDDLKPEMELQGTVRNIVDFGAFVDIGVHQDGLVHISQLADRFVKHPLDVVKVGDIVRVRVLSVDKTRKKISLTMKGVDQHR